MMRTLTRSQESYFDGLRQIGDDPFGENSRLWGR